MAKKNDGFDFFNDEVLKYCIFEIFVYHVCYWMNLIIVSSIFIFIVIIDLNSLQHNKHKNFPHLSGHVSSVLKITIMQLIFQSKLLLCIINKESLQLIQIVHFNLTASEKKKQKEELRALREQEKHQRQEQLRLEREMRAQQILEVGEQTKRINPASSVQLCACLLLCTDILLSQHLKKFSNIWFYSHFPKSKNFCYTANTVNYFQSCKKIVIEAETAV